MTSADVAIAGKRLGHTPGVTAIVDDAQSQVIAKALALLNEVTCAPIPTVV